MVGDSCDLSNSLKSELGLITSDFRLRLVNKLSLFMFIRTEILRWLLTKDKCPSTVCPNQLCDGVSMKSRLKVAHLSETLCGGLELIIFRLIYDVSICAYLCFQNICLTVKQGILTQVPEPSKVQSRTRTSVNLEKGARSIATQEVKLWLL